MNKTEFISAIAEKAELSKKDAEKVLKKAIVQMKKFKNK